MYNIDALQNILIMHFCMINIDGLQNIVVTHFCMIYDLVRMKKKSQIFMYNRFYNIYLL